MKECDFFQQKVRYLKHVISLGKLKVAAKGADSFKDAPLARALMQVSTFAGACNVYYRIFKNVYRIASLLIDMTRKNAYSD